MLIFKWDYQSTKSEPVNPVEAYRYHRKIRTKDTHGYPDLNEWNTANRVWNTVIYQMESISSNRISCRDFLLTVVDDNTPGTKIETPCPTLHLASTFRNNVTKYTYQQKNPRIFSGKFPRGNLQPPTGNGAGPRGILPPLNLPPFLLRLLFSPTVNSNFWNFPPQKALKILDNNIFWIFSDRFSYTCADRGHQSTIPGLTPFNISGEVSHATPSTNCWYTNGTKHHI